MATLTYTGTLTIIECAHCHMDFGVQPALDKNRRRDHATFYCPVGHANVYPQRSDVEALRESVEREQRLNAHLVSRLDQTQAEADHQAAVARGYKGALVKAKKRSAKGVCPVAGCKRHFVDVQRHVESKHPDYQGGEA